MYEIPTNVWVNGQSYAIRNKGDFRMVLDCFVALNDIELSKDERVCSALMIFYDFIEDISDLNSFDDIEEAVKQMYNFFNCGREDSYQRDLPKLLDWEQDSQLIASAVNKVAGKEIRAEEYIHWWTFMGYYTAIGQSALATVVSIRDKIIKGTKMEKWERDFRRENPQYFNWDKRTNEEKELDNLAKSLWNNGMG